MDNVAMLDAHGPEARSVLVVEDDPLLRFMLCDLLRAEGLVVVEAANAEEALGALAAGLDVAVVFTDVQMPGAFDGLELSRRLQASYPDVPVIVTSGHLDAALLAVGIPYLPKPYVPTKAVGLILSVLARRHAHGG
ncbi:MAG: response regulator [Pseudomonadota bacterium]